MFVPPVTLVPTPVSNKLGISLRAPRTALNGIDLTKFNTGWQRYDFTHSTNFYKDAIFPTTHQRVLEFTLTDFPRTGIMDFRNLSGLEYLNLQNGPNITDVLFTKESTSATYYNIGKLGMVSLDFTPITSMSNTFSVFDNPNLTTIIYPTATNTNNGLGYFGVTGNPLLTGIQDLRWATKGINQMFINGGEVTNWIFPDTIDTPNAEIMGNTIGAYITKTPQVADFSRTKIQGQVLWNNSNLTEFRFSSASFGNGTRRMDRFELSNSPNLTRFDFINYPSSTWGGLNLQFCNSLAILTFPEHTILFDIFNIRGCPINQHIPFDKVLISSTVSIDSTSMSAANMNSSIQALYSARALHTNTNTKNFYIDQAQINGLTGSKVAPSGYTEGSSDGTPATTNEMIWVLENQRVSLGGALKYHWIFST